MPKNEENVLVIRRALFDELGAFQGLERDADRYIDTFMTRQNNFFLPRSRAEQDPAFKQIIPYVIFTFEGTILRYVRGAKSGEKRLGGQGLRSASEATLTIAMRVSFLSTRMPIARRFTGK